MRQSSSTTYSTGTGSTSSATTLTSPGTSKGSWGDMMTSTNTGQVNQARPLPIPEGQPGKLDPVSLLSIWLEQKLIPATVHTRPRPPINIRLNANSSQIRLSNRSRPRSSRPTISRIQRDASRHSRRKGEREGKQEGDDAPCILPTWIREGRVYDPCCSTQAGEYPGQDSWRVSFSFPS
jgi:hypothetical protein